VIISKRIVCKETFQNHTGHTLKKSPTSAIKQPPFIAFGGHCAREIHTPLRDNFLPLHLSLGAIRCKTAFSYRTNVQPHCKVSAFIAGRAPDICKSATGCVHAWRPLKIRMYLHTRFVMCVLLVWVWIPSLSRVFVLRPGEKRAHTHREKRGMCQERSLKTDARCLGGVQERTGNFLKEEETRPTLTPISPALWLRRQLRILIIFVQ